MMTNEYRLARQLHAMAEFWRGFAEGLESSAGIIDRMQRPRPQAGSAHIVTLRPRDSLVEAVVRLLRASRRPMSGEEIVQRLRQSGYDVSPAGSALRRAAERGIIQFTSAGFMLRDPHPADKPDKAPS